MANKQHSSYLITILLILHGAAILARPDTGVINWLYLQYGLSPILYAMLFVVTGLWTLATKLDNTNFALSLFPLMVHTALLWWYVAFINAGGSFVAPIWYSVLISALFTLQVKERS